MNNLHLRLYSVNVPEKRAVVSVDQFFVNEVEATLAWATFERLDDGVVMYSILGVVSGGTTRRAAPTVREAVKQLTGLVEERYGPVETRIEFARDGLDSMGLWTALGAEPGLARE